jgi:PadR family transcriptional regulator PadR
VTPDVAPGIRVALRKSLIRMLYVALDRLEDKGFVSSWLSEPTAARGGRAKRCYRLEVPGERALKESLATARRMAVSVPIWGDPDKEFG